MFTFFNRLITIHSVTLRGKLNLQRVQLSPYLNLRYSQYSQYLCIRLLIFLHSKRLQLICRCDYSQAPTRWVICIFHTENVRHQCRGMPSLKTNCHPFRDRLQSYTHTHTQQNTHTIY